MNRVVFFVLLTAIWAAPAGSAQQSPDPQDPPTGEQDPNVATSVTASDLAYRYRGAPGVEIAAAPGTAIAEQIVRQVEGAKVPTNTNLCAVVVLPGPSDSYDIRLGIFNVAPQPLDVLMMDSFRAGDGESLLHQSVFGTAAPASGTLTVLYPPTGAGRGPVVLGFTSFMPFESAAFRADPDTYGNPDSGTTVADLNKTVFEAVYAEGLRCRGTLNFKRALNASVANLVQVFP